MGRPFQKGVSGNPGGRPKQNYKVMDAAKDYTVNALKTLDEIRKNKKYGAMARVAACRELLDRGWGRPPVSVDLTNSDGSMTQAWLAAMREVGNEATDETHVAH